MDDGARKHSKSDIAAMSAAVGRFAHGPAQGASEELAALVQAWGPGAHGDTPILSGWPQAAAKPTPLWLAALARSRACCPALVASRAQLSRVGSPGGPEAWRYAAHNGWAPEAAELFAAQAALGDEPRGGWPAVWAAIDEGCKAQSSGVGERAAHWIGALLGSALGAKEAKALGMLGKAWSGSAPRPEGEAQARAGGWGALADRAQELWGAPLAEEAGVAIEGEPAARDLALERCAVGRRMAQDKLDRMLADLGSGGAEIGVAMRTVMAAAMSQGKSADRGWSDAKESCRDWAASASRLMALGARLPSGALCKACSDQEWSLAYALALSGASAREGAAEPPLWQLAKSRSAPGSVNGSLAGALASLAPGKAPFDEQALDVARALVEAGAKSSDKGPDGLGALQKLREQGAGSDAVSQILGAIGAAKPQAAGLSERGLLHLQDFLAAAEEREQIEASAGAATSKGSGPSRL